jgi:hypothetical protein
VTAYYRDRSSTVTGLLQSKLCCQLEVQAGLQSAGPGAQARAAGVGLSPSPWQWRLPGQGRRRRDRLFRVSDSRLGSRSHRAGTSVCQSDSVTVTRRDRESDSVFCDCDHDLPGDLPGAVTRDIRFPTVAGASPNPKTLVLLTYNP